MLVNNIKKTTLLILLAIVGFSTNAYSQKVSKVGTTAAQFLSIPVGTRATAMGTAITAISDGPSSMYWNPAGIASIQNKELMVEYTDWFLDLDHTYLGAVLPLEKGVLGVNIVALNMGEFDETIYGRNFVPTGRTFRAYSLAIGTSYAAYLFDKLQIGVNAKYIIEKIDFSSASTLGFDVGTIYQTPFDAVKFGVSVQNIGGKLQLSGDNLTTTTDLNDTDEGDYEPDVRLATDEYNLPLTLRVGFGIDVIQKENVRTTLAIDGVSPSDNVQSLSVGVETALLNETFFIRGGLPDLGVEKNERVEKFTLGLGFDYALSEELKIRIGYSYQSYEYLNDVNRLSVQLKF